MGVIGNYPDILCLPNFFSFQCQTIRGWRLVRTVGLKCKVKRMTGHQICHPYKLFPFPLNFIPTACLKIWTEEVHLLTSL